MAIAHDVSTDGGNGSAASRSWSHTCTGSDLILFVAIYGGGTDGLDSLTVKYDGTLMTQLDSEIIGSVNHAGYLFYIVAPSTGSNTVLVEYTGTEWNGGMSSSYTGVDQSTPVPESNTNAQTSDPVTVSLTGGISVDQSWTILRTMSDGTVSGAGAGTTQRISGGASGYFLGDSNGPLSTGATSLEVDFASSLDTNANIASFAPAVVASTFVPTVMMF